ncbi:MAG: hypothetical protein WCY30_07200 [Candidatus Neomarinimicrobiota bacterium]|jgi:hypothetical protein
MEQWQKVINDSVKDKVLSEIRSIQQRADVHIGLNYTIHYPVNGFVTGSETYIPISAPSNVGPIHIGDVVLTVGHDREITNIGYIDAYTKDGDKVSLSIYEGNESEQKQETFTSLLSKINNFLGDINNIISGNRVNYLLRPNVRSSDLLQVASMPNESNGRQIIINNPQSSPARRWSEVKSSNIESEIASVSSITSKEDRKKYISGTLESMRQAPHWYTAVGGKIKEDAKDKIIELYLKTCDSAGKTVPASMFYEKLRRTMYSSGQLSAYCTRDSRTIDGTIDGECMNRQCSSYRKDCPKLSYRLNVSAVPR